MGEKISRERKQSFCAYYVILGDPVEAAVQIGIDRNDAATAAVTFLKDSACRQMLAEIRGLMADGAAVRSGLRRLAFGSCRDAVRLAFADELPPTSVIEELDLFNVSEIKRDKGGGVEIKLFDRMKALEKLYELDCENGSRDLAKELMSALTSSADTEINS